MRERDARPALVDAARRLDDQGLNHNSSGNLAVRLDTGEVLVTPTGIPAHALRPDDAVVLTADGAPAQPHQRAPTSEWRLHVEVLRRRPEVQAVVHTHSPEATAASTLRAPVPAVHYVVARFGGSDLACAPYGTYGTAELAVAVADTLGTSLTACLMANHGALALGRDLPEAVATALDVEWFCGVHRRALHQGTPAVLDDDEIERVARSFSRYGQPRA